MNIQSNSQESRHHQLKTRIRCVCDEYSTDRLLETIEDYRKTFDLDAEKYASAILNSIDGKQIEAPFGYIKKVAWSIANERHNELKKDWLPNYLDLHLKLDEIGMTGERWEMYLIDEISTHCLEEFPIEVSEMIDTLRAIVDYCKSRNKLTYRDYIRFLLSSKVAKKCNIPLPALEKKARAEYEAITKDIERLETAK